MNLLIGTLTAAACGLTAGIACPLIVGGLLVAINGAASAGYEADKIGLTGKVRESAVLKGAITATVVNTVSFGAGRLVSKPLSEIAGKLTKSHWGRKVVENRLARKFKFGPAKLKKAIEKTLEKAVTKPVAKLTAFTIRAIENRGN